MSAQCPPGHRRMLSTLSQRVLLRSFISDRMSQFYLLFPGLAGRSSIKIQKSWMGACLSRLSFAHWAISLSSCLALHLL
ncbi:hypothetical protein MPL3356_620022 [Mesorhizobium plurifarium]|uniref:Uncharacterized protein n=1 Tax=Mesorhizobium plurifarium TaxID=69974 RepID=A0A090EBF1_MESPL|nr:hypothetical protein MPL3356_620022 [Mesorhizobium plurifarium]